ncbi:MAG: TldD/PmbA family protein [Archangium sp.]|nr:TldD/PmbA family protein [Archangium sp.]
MTLFVALMVAAAPAVPPAELKSDRLLGALVDELERSKKSLPSTADAPFYYLSYRVLDAQSFGIATSLGVLVDSQQTFDPLAGRLRILDVSARVGSRRLDNTHALRGERDWDLRRTTDQLPIEDEPRALRIAIWRTTDRAYKSAVKQLVKVKTNQQVKVAEEDLADDFSADAPVVQLQPRFAGAFDREAWTVRIKKLSALFKPYPEILKSSVSLNGTGGTAYFVDSDGARLREPRFFARILIGASVKADDGMDLDLYEDIEATSLDRLPTDEVLTQRVQRLIERLLALRKAPAVEPYSGPAIITNRAAGVFFHEIFGHRIEGHRQKDADEGQTFTKRIGLSVLPEFLSVSDDPTRRTFGEIPLNGFYAFDEEGQPAQKASLVDKGILRTFLLGRSPVKGFAKSNGHGRAQPGMATVSRQGNLIIDSTKQLTPAALRAMLIEEVKKRGKPYGLVFEEISGGFTNTRAGGAPQAFKVLPLIVTRVYADGRPDELVRGVDIVGTPLASFEKILATGDDAAVFNGFCGAESGWVPVSAVSPSLLVGDIEIEKKARRHDRGPLLPSPILPAKGGAR